jgi:hypothetical protein
MTNTLIDPKAISPPDPGDLYDQIMGAIEPELTRAGLKSLEAKYKDEAPVQSKMRAEKYARAFAEYDKRAAQYMTELNAQVVEYQHAARESAEKKEREKEEPMLMNLQTQIASA